jgi:hypothetical protein
MAVEHNYAKAERTQCMTQINSKRCSQQEKSAMDIKNCTDLPALREALEIAVEALIDSSNYGWPTSRRIAEEALERVYERVGEK